MNQTETNRLRMLLILLAAAAAALLLITPLLVGISGGTPTPTPTGGCVTEVHYFAYDVEANFFGPASEFETPVTQNDELFRRLRRDPMLLVSTLEYVNHALTSPDERRAKAQAFVDDPAARCQAVDLLAAGLAKCTASLETMSGDYKTLYAVKGSDPSVIPGTYQDNPERPEYSVLRYSCPNGSGGVDVFNFKLNCGFQPVDTDFPGVPGPPTTTVTTTVNTVPVPTTPVVTVTTVPHTTPSTTPGCTVPQGCKPYTPMPPAHCGDAANPCQPGVGPAVPNPPASTQPTITVTPPVSQLPPPETLPPGPPSTVSQTIPSPVTAPA